MFLAVEYALTLPHVVHAEENLFICPVNQPPCWLRISGRGLNRVVVAAVPGPTSPCSGHSSGGELTSIV